MVTVYTKPNCVACTQTKKTLERQNTPYQLVDITLDEEAYDKVVALGFASAPVVIAGDLSWAGYQPEKLRSLAAA